MKRSTVIAFLCTLSFFFALAGGRACWESSSELRNAKSSYHRGNTLDAVVSLRRAARWYFPGNPWSKRAMLSLRERALDAEKRDDPDLALYAWRSVRGSTLGARHWVTPHPNLLDEANRHIATLMATKQPRPEMDRKKNGQALRAEHLALLQRVENAPSSFWIGWSLFSFLCWIYCVYGAIDRLFEPMDKSSDSPHQKLRRMGIMICSALLSLASFLFGLWIA